ncbi:MAG TPA: DUF2062 domain-containing protein [Candidatus Babeliales bacterium]|nr:DUF2062 domain-containing protein [Candidatus Babeliales bacterium]
MIFTKLKLLAERLVAQEQSPHKLALTCALGVFVGISPLIGLHTIMTLLFGWIFALNIPTIFAISVLINNPWTMVPVYSIDHFFGRWLFSTLNIDYVNLDPTWIESCNLFLKEHTGVTGLSLSAFLIGGNVLALAVSCILYPCMKRMFTIYLSQKLLPTR